METDREGPVNPPAAADTPATLVAAVRREFARALHPPFETFVVVAVNGVMMAVIWFVLPPKLKDEVFTIHGSLGFALVLAAWMYSDVPATNVLGSDATRTAVAVGDPVSSAASSTPRTSCCGRWSPRSASSWP